MAEVPSTTAPWRPTLALDGDDRLAQDLTCIKCAYNLRGALRDGRCPECGLAVMRSASGHWLRFCEPTWLKRIWGGLNGLAVLIAAAGVLTLLAWSGLLDLKTPLPEWLVIALPAVIISVGIGLGIWGVWRATAPDPSGLRERSRMRRATRWLFAATLLYLPVVAPALSALFAGYDVDGLVLFGVVVLLLATVVALVLYGRSLALRVPHVPLARASLVAAVLLPIPALPYITLEANPLGWRYFLGRTLTSLSISRYSLHTRLDQLELATGVATLVAILLLSPLFVWFYVVLAREAGVAWRTWARQ